MLRAELMASNLVLSKSFILVAASNKNFSPKLSQSVASRAGNKIKSLSSSSSCGSYFFCVLFFCSERAVRTSIGRGFCFALKTLQASLLLMSINTKGSRSDLLLWFGRNGTLSCECETPPETPMARPNSTTGCTL